MHLSTCAAFETPAPAVCAAPASVVEVQRAQSQLLYNSCCEQQRRCGVTSLTAAASSKDVAAPSLLTAVAAAEALRRHFSSTAVGSSRDVAASLSKTAVAVADWFSAGPFCRALRSLEFTLELEEESIHTTSCRVTSHFAVREAWDQVNALQISADSTEEPDVVSVPADAVVECKVATVPAEVDVEPEAVEPCRRRPDIDSGVRSRRSSGSKG